MLATVVKLVDSNQEEACSTSRLSSNIGGGHETYGLNVLDTSSGNEGLQLIGGDFNLSIGKDEGGVGNSKLRHY